MRHPLQDVRAGRPQRRVEVDSIDENGILVGIEAHRRAKAPFVGGATDFRPSELDRDRAVRHARESNHRVRRDRQVVIRERFGRRRDRRREQTQPATLMVARPLKTIRRIVDAKRARVEADPFSSVAAAANARSPTYSFSCATSTTRRSTTSAALTPTSRSDVTASAWRQSSTTAPYSTRASASLTVVGSMPHRARGGPTAWPLDSSREEQRAHHAQRGPVAAVRRKGSHPHVSHDILRDVNGWQPRDGAENRRGFFGVTARSEAFVASFILDLKHALRMLLRAPGFALMAIVTLALGVAAATTIFSVVSGVLLEPLPFHRPDRLVQMFETNQRTDAFSTSEPTFLDMRTQTRTLADVAAFRYDTCNLESDGDPQQLSVAADVDELVCAARCRAGARRRLRHRRRSRRPSRRAHRPHRRALARPIRRARRHHRPRHPPRRSGVHRRRRHAAALRLPGRHRRLHAARRRSCVRARQPSPDTDRAAARRRDHGAGAGRSAHARAAPRRKISRLQSQLGHARHHLAGVDRRAAGGADRLGPVGGGDAAARDGVRQRRQPAHGAGDDTAARGHGARRARRHARADRAAAVDRELAAVVRRRRRRRGAGRRRRRALAPARQRQRAAHSTRLRSMRACSRSRWRSPPAAPSPSAWRRCCSSSRPSSAPPSAAPRARPAAALAAAPSTRWSPSRSRSRLSCSSAPG